jgi:hypothetical protein
MYLLATISAAASDTKQPPRPMPISWVWSPNPSHAKKAMNVAANNAESTSSPITASSARGLAGWSSTICSWRSARRRRRVAPSRTISPISQRQTRLTSSSAFR